MQVIRFYFETPINEKTHYIYPACYPRRHQTYILLAFISFCNFYNAALTSECYSSFFKTEKK